MLPTERHLTIGKGVRRVTHGSHSIPRTNEIGAERVEHACELIDVPFGWSAGVILKKEDETRAKEENGFSGLVNKYRDEGKARNRNRYI
jgi:hypothetical protein